MNSITFGVHVSTAYLMIQELEKIRKHGEERLPPSQGGQHNDLDSWKATDGDELWAYSGTEMRKAYYEAFWRARYAV